VPFKRAALVLKDLAGIHISVSSVNKRYVDIGSKLSASAPVRQVAAEDVKRAEISTDSCCVNTTDGWEEIKTAAIGAEGLQTRYIAAIQAAEKFGLRMRKEFLGSATRKAGEVVVVADGAKWIWNQVGINFPFRTHEIVEYWHAAQQIWTCARARWGEGAGSAGGLSVTVIYCGTKVVERCSRGSSAPGRARSRGAKRSGS